MLPYYITIDHGYGCGWQSAAFRSTGKKIKQGWEKFGIVCSNVWWGLASIKEWYFLQARAPEVSHMIWQMGLWKGTKVEERARWVIA